VKKSNLKTAFKVVVIFIFGIMLGFLAGRNLREPDLSDQPDLLRLNGYKFTNPLLDIEPKRYVGVKEFGSLENQLQDYINDQKTKGNLTKGSVYFRDLKNGPWFGVDEKEPFSPASLLKLPVMMAYLKQAESDKALLSRQVKNEGVVEGTAPAFKQSKILEKDKTYATSQLIEQMITQSDNDALSLLEKNIDNGLINKVTLDLGITTATDQTPEDFLSVKEYATLYRVLYNSSYLNREMSEKALEILSRTVFKQGIAGGLSNNVVVAHKFGERELENGIKQLHDCGIVYYPNHPYLICIMTKGYDYQKLSTIIQSISRQIFEDVSQRFKNP